MCTGTALMLMAGMSAAGTIMQGQAANKAAQQNAQMEEAQAAQERDSAAAHAEKLRRAAGVARGEATAAYGASGVNTGAGSAVQIDQDIANRSEQDAMATLLYGERRGRAMDMQAGMTRAAGKNARNGSYVQAVSSILSGYDRSQTDRWRRSRDQQQPAPIVNKDVWIG